VALVLEVNQGEVDCHTLVYGRLGTPCSNPGAVRCVGELRPKLRPVVRPVGLRHVGQECRPLTRQMQATPEPVAGRAHGRRLDRGLGPHAAAEPHGDRVGVKLIVLGRASMDRLQLEGVSQDNGNARRGA
jgi:hypothetical protein